jgi:hypothetical protein
VVWESKVRVRQGRAVVFPEPEGAAYKRLRGEWIAFQDSDDEWVPDRNRQFMEAAAQVPSDVAWIFGDLRVVTDEGDVTSLYEEFGLTVDGPLQVFSDSMRVVYPFHFGLLQGSFIRRSALLELDCFNEGLQHSEDLLAAFQVACRPYRFAAIPSVVGRYFRTSDLTANSAVVKGHHGADYFRARMLCFALDGSSGTKAPLEPGICFRRPGVEQGPCQAGKVAATPGGAAISVWRSFGERSSPSSAQRCVGITELKYGMPWLTSGEKFFPNRPPLSRGED